MTEARTVARESALVGRSPPIAWLILFVYGSAKFCQGTSRAALAALLLLLLCFAFVFLNERFEKACFATVPRPRSNPFVKGRGTRGCTILPRCRVQQWHRWLLTPVTNCLHVPIIFVCLFALADFSYSSDRLYLEGGTTGVTCEDVVNKRALPQALQEELLRSRGQDVVSTAAYGICGRGCSRAWSPRHWLNRLETVAAPNVPEAVMWCATYGNGGDLFVSRLSFSRVAAPRSVLRPLATCR